MPIVEDLPLAELPEATVESAAHAVAEFSIGLLRIETTANGQEDAVLLGSGTLVSVGAKRAVLTAHHVLSILPRIGRLGLIISPNLQQHTVDISGLAYLRIARGTRDADGPDLGAVMLAPSIGSAIAARKTFYNLDMRRDQMLHWPPDLHDGVWFVNGFIDENTISEPGRDGYGLVKGFYNLSGAGGPKENAVVVGEHDYFAFPVSYGARSVAPTSFGGMSGGGLWQVPLVRDLHGQIKHKTPLLSGIVFYQDRTTGDRGGVKSHGRRSVYRVAYETIRDGIEP